MGVLSTLVVSPDAKSRGGRRIDALGEASRGVPLRPPCRDPDRPLAATGPIAGHALRRPAPETLAPPAAGQGADLESSHHRPFGNLGSGR
ncbi:hypothetical protein CTI14_03920 [Methylobacterium radiotolerans]|nr:hypothetical protein CTI14_03920 [Methylobacterium radiotolerans]